MTCEPARQLNDHEFLQAFNKKVSSRRVPLSGNIDITHRCNLRCVHCYIGDQDKARADSANELATAQWLRIIDEITAAGCLFFLITGGEPLLRRDFKEIYTHAKTNGLLVTVFTNGTLIDETTLDLFSELPPRAVEITLYGASRQTYQKITGVAGSYDRCIAAIENLSKREINVRLKTMLMSANRHEFSAIEDTARRYGAKFRFDAALFPTLDGDKAPIELRVNPRDAIDLEFSNEERAQDWKDFYQRTGNLSQSDELYRCGAGRTHFHIDPYGYLQPCLMVTNLRYNLVGGSFAAGWNEVMTDLRNRKAQPGYVCTSCEKRTLCGFCPGFAVMENGAEEAYSEYLCEMGRLRYEKVCEAI